MDKDLVVAPRALSTAKFLMTPTEVPREKKAWDAASRHVITLVEAPIINLDAVSASKSHAPNHPVHDHASSSSSNIGSDLGHGRGSSYSAPRTSVPGYQWAAGDAAPSPATNTNTRHRNSMVGSIPAAHQDHFRQPSTGTGSTPDPAAAAGLTQPASSNKAGKPSLSMMAGSLSPQQIRKLHGNVFSTGSAPNTESNSVGNSSLPESLSSHSSPATKQTHMQQQQALLLSQLGIKAAEAACDTTTATDENAAQPTSPVAKLQRRSRSLDAPTSGSTSATPATTTSAKESGVLEQYAHNLGLKPGRRTRSLDPPKVHLEVQSAKQPKEPGKSFFSKLTTGWVFLSGHSQQQPAVQQSMHTASALAAVGGGVPADSNNRAARITPKSGTSGTIYMGPQRTSEGPLHKAHSSPGPGSEYASTADSNAPCGKPGGLPLERNKSYHFQYFVPRIESIDRHAFQHAAESESTHYSKNLMHGRHR